MVAQNVATILGDHVRLSVECIDRMYLNVYVPALQLDRGVAWFFRGHRQQPFASSALMAPMSRRFVAALERSAQAHELEVVQFRPGERKDDVMAERLRRFDRDEGVVFIGKAQEKAAVFRTEKRRDAQGRPYPWIVRSTGDGEAVLHLRRRPRLRAVLPEVLQLLPVQRQALLERP